MRFLWLLALLICGSHGIYSLADNLSTEVDVSSRAIFVPVGFDDNDEVTVVLDGYLPDPCHRLLKPFVSVDPVFKRITVGARARLFTGACPDVTVPFTQEVRVGELKQGDYTVLSRDGKLSQRLSIRRSSTPGPDDHLYAPVDSVRIEYPAENRWVAVLEGRFTNTCLSIQDTQVYLTGRTIQVLPIMKFGSEEECGVPCHVVERSFRVEVELPALPEEGRYLLHVRSLNGEAVNEVFSRTPSLP